MIKLRFFHDFRLLNAVYDVILITLMVCTPMVLHAHEDGRDGGDGSGVTVTIRSVDAQRLRELTRLREETGLAAEAVKRLELENESLREEKAELRAELFEIKEKFAKQNANYRQLQLWLAGVPAEGTVRKSGRREEQLLQAMGEVSKDGSALALSAVSFCEQVQQLLKELPIGKVRQAEIQLQLDGLSKDARRFIALTESGIQLQLDGLSKDARRFIALTEPGETVAKGIDPLRTCRILAVNRELSIVVLSVGSVKGAFAGMIYRVGKDRQIQLRVVSVRPYAAAAEVVKGTIGDLAPGMEAVAGESREAESPETVVPVRTSN